MKSSRYFTSNSSAIFPRPKQTAESFQGHKVKRKMGPTCGHKVKRKMGPTHGHKVKFTGCVKYFIMNIDVGIFTGMIYNQNVSKFKALRRLNSSQKNKICCLFKCPALPPPLGSNSWPPGHFLTSNSGPWEKTAVKCLGFAQVGGGC